MICTLCGYDKYEAGYGHRYGGKHTPPKTLWCLGDPTHQRTKSPVSKTNSNEKQSNTTDTKEQ